MPIEIAPIDTISFQTGRVYSKNGQRIAAARIEGGHIAFLDLDRHIQGVITSQMIDLAMLDLDRVSVMWAYDHGDKVRYWEHVGLADDFTWTALRAIASTVPSLNL